LWEVIDPENQPEKAGRVAKTKWVHVLVAHMVFLPSLMMHAYAIGSGCPPFTYDNDVDKEAYEQ
jgi:hypothetical protein